MADKNLFLKNYYFYGKHAEMADALVATIDDESGSSIFNTVVELFVMAALVGVKNDHKAKPDSNKSMTKNIMAEQFNSHSDEVQLAFKFVTLLGNKDKYDEVTRLNKTFRNPETDENYQQFEEYMLGGLEDLYNTFILSTHKTYNDYLIAVNQFLGSLKEEDDDDNVDIPDAENLF